MSERAVTRLQRQIADANASARKARDSGWTELAAHFERHAVELAMKVSTVLARVG